MADVEIGDTVEGIGDTTIGAGGNERGYTDGVEKKPHQHLTIGEAMENMDALAGTLGNPATGLVPLTGLKNMPVPPGKTNMNIAINLQRLRRFAEIYNEQMSAFGRLHCVLDDRGYPATKFKTTKDGDEYQRKVKEYRGGEYPEKMLRLNMDVLMKTPGVLPEHISLLLPIIDGEQKGT